MSLTHQDVEKLARTSSVKGRVNVAGKIAQGFSDGQLVGREKDVAIDIFRLLVRDAQAKVRQALSRHLSRCNDIPHDVALSLAKDVQEVSIPMLEHSAVLTEEDLVAIVQSSRELGKLLAVSRRKYVPETLSDALLSVGNAGLTRSLIRNKGAQIWEASLLRLIDDMADEESVIDALVERGGLPVACVEKIFLSVSGEMKKKLAQKQHVSRHLLEGKLQYAREWATLGVTRRTDEEDVAALVRQLYEERRLTSSLIIRALCVGDVPFFAQALAVLTGTPAANVQKLLLDAGPLGFKALYKASPLPPNYYDAVKKLLDVTLEESEGGAVFDEDFSDRVIDNIVSNGYDLSIEYMPLLLTIIKGNASELSTIH